ncbi:class I SAM-dependent methyltransferase [Streptomyces sp. NPDC006997]|uniref:class I SAM-dependent methyltransferase n=1 Tax=Streptomyces sp. NPDC006997 TaxID=3155356 RepID=UPI0033C0F5BB
MSHDIRRGGHGAPWWDRLYETDAREYIDQPEHAERAARVLRALDRFQRITLGYRRQSAMVLAATAGAPEPRILELGAGHGRLAARILDRCPAALVTVSDVEPSAVAAFRAGPLAGHPRVTSRVIDATAIDAASGAWDVAVFAMSLHHLDPAQVRRLLCEGTRVARRLLIIDAWRHPAFLAVAPLFLVLGGRDNLHDGVISLRKAYSASALHDLAADCGAAVALDTRFSPPGYLVASAHRRGTARDTTPVGQGRSLTLT